MGAEANPIASYSQDNTFGDFLTFSIPKFASKHKLDHFQFSFLRSIGILDTTAIGAHGYGIKHSNADPRKSHELKSSLLEPSMPISWVCKCLDFHSNRYKNRLGVNRVFLGEKRSL